MEADIEQGEETANSASNEEEPTERNRTGRGGTDNPGRANGSKRSNLQDLVTYKDIRDSVKVMKSILRDKGTIECPKCHHQITTPIATHSQKLTAAKFMLSVKLEGLNLLLKRDQLKRSPKQNNSKPDKPSHIIKTHYKETPTEPAE